MTNRINKKITISAVSALLITVMLLLVLIAPISAVNDGINTEEINNSLSEELSLSEIYEIESMRDEKTKYISLGNGKYEAVSYSRPVHRRDKNGNLVDINNTLILSDGKYKTPDNRVSFNKTSASFVISENGYQIGMALLTENKLAKTQSLSTASEATVQNHAQRMSDTELNLLTAKQKIEKLKEVNNKSSVLYSEVSEGTDIEYVLLSNDVKENIIINKRQNSYTYSFTLVTKGLYASEAEDGSILLYDSESDECVYTIPAPYMYDANDIYSYDVSYTLISKGEGAYILTVEASEEFINASDRAFPVTIDPTVTTTSYTYDTYISSSAPTSSYGQASPLIVSTLSKIAFIHIAKPSIPSGATVTGSYMYIPYYFSDSFVRADIVAHQVSMNWNENTLTWNSASATTNLSAPKPVSMGHYTAGLSQQSLEPMTSAPAYAGFDISDAAEAWYAGTANNYGIAFEMVGGTTDNMYIYSQQSSAGYASYMTVSYTYYLPDGVYAIKNVGSPSYYMRANMSSAISAGTLEKKSYTTSPTTAFTREALFKIYRDTATDRYVIRTMINNEYGIGWYTGTAFTKKISTNDSLVALSDTFHIEYDSAKGGFYIRPYNVGYVVNLNSSSTVLDSVTKTYATNSAVWSFEQYTGSTRNGGNVYGSAVKAGGSTTLSPYVWSTVIGRNEAYIGESSPNASVATIQRSSTNSDVTLYAHDDGSYPMTVYAKNPMANTMTSVLSFNVSITLPFEEGTYLFRNKELGNYMQIDDGASPGYSTSGSIMELWDLDVGSYQKWQVTHVTDGYYKITSSKSSLALSVQSSYLNTSDKSIVQESYTGSDRQLWYFTEASSEAYVIRPKSGESYSTDWCLCAGGAIAGSSIDGRNVEQRAYNGTNTSYLDEWWLYEIGVINDVELEGQEQSKWCWAASARMFAKNYGTVLYSQRQAVYEVMDFEENVEEDGEGNVGGELLHVRSAIRYYKDGDIEGDSLALCTASGYIYSQDVTKRFMNDGHVILVSTGVYSDLSDPTSRMGGHFIVIAGYVYLNGSVRFVVYDSLPEDEGSIYLISYDKLVLSSNAEVDETITLNTVWDGLIVAITSYSDSSLIPCYTNRQN